MLIKYLRHTKVPNVSKGIPYGVVIAKKDETGQIRYGWSKCHQNDKFSKEKALMIANNRASCIKQRNKDLPEDVIAVMSEMIDRSKRYFK